MSWVLDHSPKEASYVAQLNGTSELRDVQKLESDDAKSAWAESVPAGDSVFTLFGVTDRITLRLNDRKAVVHRVAPHHVKEARVQLEQETGRREPHVLRPLAEIVRKRTDLFYPFRPLDQRIAKVRATARAYYTIQEKLRKPAELRLHAAYRELYLVDPIRKELKEEQYVNQRLAESPVFEAFTAEEAQWEERLTEALKGIPVWDKVLKGKRARGVGTLLGGVLVGEIGDIRRFPHENHLVSYCKYHAVPAPKGLADQGIATEYARRREGTLFSCNRRLRQAIWKWSAVQVPKMAVQERFADDPWVQLFKARQAYEHHQVREVRKIVEPVLVTLPSGKKLSYWTDGHLHRRSCRHLAKKFLIWFYREWNTLVEAGEM